MTAFWPPVWNSFLIWIYCLLYLHWAVLPLFNFMDLLVGVKFFFYVFQGNEGILSNLKKNSTCKRSKSFRIFACKKIILFCLHARSLHFYFLGNIEFHIEFLQMYVRHSSIAQKSTVQVNHKGSKINPWVFPNRKTGDEAIVQTTFSLYFVLVGKSMVSSYTFPLVDTWRNHNVH